MCAPLSGPHSAPTLLPSPSWNLRRQLQPWDLWSILLASPEQIGWPLLLVLICISLVAGQVERLSLHRFLQHLELWGAPSRPVPVFLGQSACLFLIFELILDSVKEPLLLKCCTLFSQAEACLFTF